LEELKEEVSDVFPGERAAEESLVGRGRWGKDRMKSVSE